MVDHFIVVTVVVESEGNGDGLVVFGLIMSMLLLL